MKIYLIVFMYSMFTFSHAGMSIDVIELKTIQDCAVIKKSIESIRQGSPKLGRALGIETRCVEIESNGQ